MSIISDQNKSANDAPPRAADVGADVPVEDVEEEATGESDREIPWGCDDLFYYLLLLLK